MIKNRIQYCLTFLKSLWTNKTRFRTVFLCYCLLTIVISPELKEDNNILWRLIHDTWNETYGIDTMFFNAILIGVFIIFYVFLKVLHSTVVILEFFTESFLSQSIFVCPSCAILFFGFLAFQNFKFAARLARIITKGQDGFPKTNDPLGYTVFATLLYVYWKDFLWRFLSNFSSRFKNTSMSGRKAIESYSGPYDDSEWVKLVMKALIFSNSQEQLGGLFFTLKITVDEHHFFSENKIRGNYFQSSGALYHPSNIPILGPIYRSFNETDLETPIKDQQWPKYLQVEDLIKIKFDLMVFRDFFDACIILVQNATNEIDIKLRRVERKVNRTQMFLYQNPTRKKGKKRKKEKLLEILMKKKPIDIELNRDEEYFQKVHTTYQIGQHLEKNTNLPAAVQHFKECAKMNPSKYIFQKLASIYERMLKCQLEEVYDEKTGKCLQELLRNLMRLMQIDPVGRNRRKYVERMKEFCSLLCIRCGKDIRWTKLKKCDKCGVIRVCSEDCHKESWLGFHKKVCRALKKFCE